MRTTTGSRMGILLALTLVAALPPATVAASAPEPSPVLDPMAAAADLLDGIRTAPRDQVVFGPAKWAFSNRTTPRSTFRLRLGAVRNWINIHFGS